MPVDPQTARYEDLTAAETPSVIHAVARLLIDLDEDAARRIANLSLDLEHLISTMPMEPVVQTGGKVDEIREFRDALEHLIDERIKLHILGERVTSDG